MYLNTPHLKIRLILRKYDVRNIILIFNEFRKTLYLSVILASFFKYRVSYLIKILIPIFIIK